MAAVPQHVLIATLGSRGDVQPFVNLGLALVATGCRVTLAVEERLLPVLAEHAGLLGVAVVHGDSCGAIFSGGFLDTLKHTAYPALQMARYMAAWAKTAVPALVVASFEAALDGVDVVVAHPLAASATAALCESRGIPWVYATLQPVFVTSCFPDLIVAGESGRISALNSPRVNRATYSVLSNLFWLSEKPWVDPLRKRLGLRVLPHSVIHADLLSRLGVPIIIASSLLFVPGGVRPRDWPPNLITGFLFPPASAHDEQPMDPKLAAFVSHVDPRRSRPLVVIGFGSLPFLGGGAALLQLAIDVADAGRLRVLLLTGWTSDHDAASGAPPPPRRTHEHVFVARAAPHDAVFRCAAAVAHHGGAGTCGACLRAGVPQVPCPLLVDQPHNGAALVALGVAPASLQLNKLTGATLGAALSAAAREPQYKHQALDAAAKVEAESEAGMKLAVHAVMSATVPAEWATRGDGGAEGRSRAALRGASRSSLVAGVALLVVLAAVAATFAGPPNHDSKTEGVRYVLRMMYK